MRASPSVLCRCVIRVAADFDETAGGADLLDIHWNEHGGRTLGRETRAGVLVRVILPADQSLEHGSVLHDAADGMIVVNLLPCQALVIRPPTPHRFAEICYAIGNLHLPAEITANEILIPASESALAAVAVAGIPHDIEIRRVRTRRDDLPRIRLSREIEVTADRTQIDEPSRG